MSPRPIRRPTLAALILGTLAILPTGCGSNKPTTGSQIDVTIPKEVAAKQNDAYKDYAKQNRANGPAGASPGQRDRMGTPKR